MLYQLEWINACQQFVKKSQELLGILWLQNYLPSETMLGWIPFSNKDYAAFKSAPANMTTEVVPSPASISWALEISTN